MILAGEFCSGRLDLIPFALAALIPVNAGIGIETLPAAICQFPSHAGTAGFTGAHFPFAIWYTRCLLIFMRAATSGTFMPADNRRFTWTRRIAHFFRSFA